MADGPRGHNGSMKRILRLYAMLRRRAAALPEPLNADGHAAIARCAACRATGLCDELLATRGSGGNRSFCPNAHYIEHLREIALKF
jgi:hypothetical protein